MNKSNPLFNQMRANRQKRIDSARQAEEREVLRCGVNYRAAFAGKTPPYTRASNYSESMEIFQDHVTRAAMRAAEEEQTLALTLASVAATEAVHFAKTGEIRKYTADCRTGAIAWGAPV